MKPSLRMTCTMAVCLGLFASRSGGENGAAATSPAATKPGAAATRPGAARRAATRPGATRPATAPGKADEVSVAFRNMSVEQICSFLADKLNKPVLASSLVKGKKITIICKKKLPLKEALDLVRQAMLDEGIMVEELPTLVRIRPVGEAMQARLPRVPADKPVSTIEDRLAIATKEFLIRHYDVSKLVAVLKPMLPSFGHVMADPDTGKLVVTDTVANLLRIEQVIASMDVPLAERTLTEIIKVQHGDAGEIVAIVRWLIAGRMGIHVKDITTGGAAPSKPQKAPSGPSRPSGSRGAPPGLSRGPSPRPSPSKKGKPPAAVGVTQIEPSKTLVTLVPHVSRNWIIAVAPADVMAQIRTWVQELDKPREVQKDYELYDVKHADVDDVARRIERAIQSMPSAELRETTQVVPFGQAEKLIVFGSRAGRELVKDLLSRLDVESAQKRIRKTIELKNADAEEMADRIETLFSAMQVAFKSSYYTSYRRSEDAAAVSVVPDKRRNAITVITDPKTMIEIEALIKEEDVPVDPGKVKPKVYELKYVNAGDMMSLLTDMFSAKEASRGGYFDWIFGRSSSRTEAKAVGRLLGQFTFQVLPSSNKLIVNAKSVANYQVIDELIEELDQPQEAGLPAIIELKHANAEDICEQLNALLAEPSTLARIRRASRGLLDTPRPGPSRSPGRSAEAAPAPNQPRTIDPGTMEFWWQGFKRPPGEVPTSNLIGKIRFVPVNRRNALMVLAPEAYKKPIEDLIAELDQPGRQVMIQARIGEIQHDDQTTLGLRIASDPSILPPADTALGGSASAEYTEAFLNGTLVLGAKANVSALLHLLIKTFGLKILLEPSITTSDNQASEYFDGRDVPVQTEARTSAEGTTTVTEIDYEQVGTRIRVRPHITKNGSVDLMINLEISRIVPGSTALGNFIFDRREVTTHVIVQDAQTIMLSGIIRQEEFDEVRKVPLLGDLPLIGKLFRSIDTGVRNRELVVFITPRVMSTAEEVDAEMAAPQGTLKRIEKSIRPRAAGGAAP